MFRRNFLACSVLLLSLAHAGPSFAQTLFSVKSKDGAVTFEVTEEVLAGMKQTAYKAVLAASDGETSDVKGPLLRDVLKAAGLTGTGVLARALDNYEMVVPAEDYDTHDVILAVEVNGKRLSVRDKGPAWIVYPSVDKPELQGDVYQSRSVWQIKELIVQ